MLGLDRAQQVIPIFIMPTPMFDAQGRLMRSRHRVILISARLCRVLVMLVDFVWRLLVIGPDAQVASNLCGLARFAITGDLGELAIIPAVGKGAGVPSPHIFARNILVFVSLHEHGHFRHHHIEASDGDVNNPVYEIEADAFAWQTFAGAMRGLSSAPIGASVAMLFHFYLLCEKYLASHDPGFVPQAMSRFKALAAMADGNGQMGMSKFAAPFQFVHELSDKYGWLL